MVLIASHVLPDHGLSPRDGSAAVPPPSDGRSYFNHQNAVKRIYAAEPLNIAIDRRRCILATVSLFPH
jgi:hypothetical protein